MNTEQSHFPTKMLHNFKVFYQIKETNNKGHIHMTWSLSLYAQSQLPGYYTHLVVKVT